MISVKSSRTDVLTEKVTIYNVLMCKKIEFQIFDTKLENLITQKTNLNMSKQKVILPAEIIKKLNRIRNSFGSSRSKNNTLGSNTVEHIFSQSIRLK